MVQRTIGRKLRKSSAVHEIDDSSDETEFNDGETENVKSRTEWELLQDIYFKNRFTRARNASQESFMEDEESCEINLSRMYQEVKHSKMDKLPSLKTDPPQEVMDELIRSIGAEKSESVNEVTDMSLVSLE